MKKRTWTMRAAAVVLSIVLVIGTLPMTAIAATINKLEDHTYTLLWTTDPQWYSFAYPDIISHQNQWVLDNYKRLDVRYTFHTGDFVNYPDDTTQWNVMDKAYKLWDNADYPYGVLAGNHDVVPYKVDSTTGAVTAFNHDSYSKYFGEDRFNDQPWYGESFEDNFGHYDLMTIDGTDFIFVYMGYNSVYNDDVYNWLNYVLSKHADRVATLCFHDYLQANGERSPNGELFFQKVVLKNPNVRMVMCGHNYNSTRKIEDIDDNGDGVADRTVYQIMANYQSTTKGGNGFMRFMECDTAAGEIACRTYSPYTQSFGSDYEDGKMFDEYGTRDNFTIPFDFSQPTPKASGDPEYGTVVVNASVAFAATDSDTVISLPVYYQNTAENCPSYRGVGVYDRYFSADATDAFGNPKMLDYVIARYTQGKGYAVSWVVDGDSLADGEIVSIPHDGIVIAIPNGKVDLNRLELGRKIVTKGLNGITVPNALKPITLMINGTLYSVNATNRLTGNNEWVIYDTFSGYSTVDAGMTHKWNMLFAFTPVNFGFDGYVVDEVQTTLGVDKQMNIPRGGFILAINTYSGGKVLAESIRRLLPVGTNVQLDGYALGEEATVTTQSLLPPSVSDWTLETDAAVEMNNGAQTLYKSGGADSGTWPAADYAFKTPITFDPAATALHYDYTLETNGKVNVMLFFKGSTPSEGSGAKKLSIQSYFNGANISSGSGDMKGDDVWRVGKIDLSTVAIPDEYYNDDGTLTINHIRVMNAGYIGKKFYINDLSLTTDINEDVDKIEQTVPLVGSDIIVKDETLAGGYVYDNGQLSVTADTDNGYEVVMTLNEDVNVSVLKNWLVNLNSSAKFDIKLTVTTSNGDATYGLVSEFGPAFSAANGYIPAGNYSKSFDLLSCYTWNGVLPASGISTVKTMTVKLGSAGTLNIHASQLTNTTYGGYFADGVYKEESTPKNVLESDVYRLQDGYLFDASCGTTVDALLSNLSSGYIVEVAENSSVVSGNTLAKTGQVVTVKNGDTVLASYTLVLKGDVLGTGKISTSGIRLILKESMGVSSLTDLQRLAADADDSGNVNTNDVRELLKMLNA